MTIAYLLDTFTDAAGTLLSAHTPDISTGGWTSSAPVLDGTHVRLSLEDSPDTIVVHPGVTPPTNDWRVELKVNFASTDSPTDTPLFDFQFFDSVGNFGFSLNYDANGIDFAVFDASVDGGVFFDNQPLALSQGHDYVIEVRVTGGSTTLVVNGTTVLTAATTPPTPMFEFQWQSRIENTIDYVLLADIGFASPSSPPPPGGVLLLDFFTGAGPLSGHTSANGLTYSAYPAQGPAGVIGLYDINSSNQLETNVNPAITYFKTSGPAIGPGATLELKLHFHVNTPSDNSWVGVSWLDSFADFNGFDIQLTNVNGSDTHWRLNTYFQTGGNEVTPGGVELHTLGTTIAAGDHVLEVDWNAARTVCTVFLDGTSIYSSGTMTAISESLNPGFFMQNNVPGSWNITALDYQSNSVLLRDDFTGSGNLAGRTPDGVNGGAWQDDSFWYGGSAATQTTINFGLLKSSVAGAVFNWGALAPLTAAPVDAYIEARIQYAPAADGNGACLGLRRPNVSSGNGVFAEFIKTGASGVNVNLSRNGTPSHTGTDSGTFTVANNSDYVARIEAQGLTVRVYLDGTLVLTITLGASMAGGNAYVAAFFGTLSTQVVNFDYVQVGALAAAPPPPPPPTSAPSATMVTLPYNAAVPVGGTVAWYSFVVGSTDDYFVSTQTSTATGADTFVTIYDSTGALVADNDDNDQDASFLSRAEATLTPGTYYASVSMFPTNDDVDWDVEGTNPIPAGIILTAGLNEPPPPPPPLTELRAVLPALTSNLLDNTVSMKSSGVASSTLEAQTLLVVTMTSSGILASTLVPGVVVPAEMLVQATMGSTWATSQLLEAVMASLGTSGAVLGVPDSDSETWVMNLGTQGTTNYTNYGFNSFALIGQRYYGAGPTGIHVLDGDTDAGAVIRANVSLGKLDFGTALQKTISHAYVGMSAKGNLFMKVIVGEGDEARAFVYRTRSFSQSLMQQRIVCGQGLKANYAVVELYNENGADFEIDTVEFHVADLKRRI